MSEEFVTVQMPRFMTSFRSDVQALPGRIVERAAPVLRSAEEESIRERWFDTGATLKSLRERFKRRREGQNYRLWPTTPYAIFGEIGTKFIKPRRYSRIAVSNARPKVIAEARQEVKDFVRNMAVN